MNRVFLMQGIAFALLAWLYLYLGLHEHYLFIYFWFDILLHILGGLWVAVLGAWAFSRLGVHVTFWQLLGLALAVGIAWEMFEYLFGIGGSNFMSYQADTLKDLADDCVGGALGFFLLRITARDTIE